jgi:hypothetical protein
VKGLISALIKTWLSVAITDALFASAVGAMVTPHATPPRIFRGVAAVLLGRPALDGGLGTAAIGLAIHFGVALFWSSVFVLAVRNWSWLRQQLARWPRAIAVASVYGVSIWLIMTWLVIPAMIHRPPTFGLRYWIQLVGHIPFVALPMVVVNRQRGAA